MPYAITLRLDAAAAARIVSMWQRLATGGLSDDAIRLGYAPHVTLAVFADDADAGRLLAAARDCAAKWRALTVRLASLGLFPGTPATLFLAPIASSELIAMHAELLTSLPGEPVEQHYLSDRWVPHITLAKDLIDPAAALSVLLPARLPISATLACVEVVRFRPVQVLARHLLPASA